MEPNNPSMPVPRQFWIADKGKKTWVPRVISCPWFFFSPWSLPGTQQHDQKAGGSTREQSGGRKAFQEKCEEQGPCSPARKATLSLNTLNESQTLQTELASQWGPICIIVLGTFYSILIIKNNKISSSLHITVFICHPVEWLSGPFSEVIIPISISSHMPLSLRPPISTNSRNSTCNSVTSGPLEWFTSDNHIFTFYWIQYAYQKKYTHPKCKVHWVLTRCTQLCP